MSTFLPRTLSIALAAIASLATPSVFADPPRHGHGKGPPAHAGGPERRDAPPPGWRKQAWHRGDRLPLHELRDGDWIDDYLRHHLKAPPPGHRWVRQSDTEYLMIDVATGLVLDALSR